MKKLFPILIFLFTFLIPQTTFAQEACNPTGNVCGQTAYDTCTPICLGTDAAYSCYQSSNPNCIGQILCRSENSRCQQSIPTPTAYTTPAYNTPYTTPNTPTATCQTDCSKCQTVTTCGTKTYDTCVDDKGQQNSSTSFCQNNAQKFRCYANGNTNCTSSNNPTVLNDYNYSCSACNNGTAPTTPTPVVTETPTVPIQNPSVTPSPSLPVVTVTNVTTEINGQKITLNVNNPLNIHLPITDLTKESDVPIKITATYSNGTTKDFYLTFHYKPKTNSQSQNPNACLAASQLPIKVPVLVLEYYPPDPKNSNLLDGIETGWKQDATVDGRTLKFWEDKTQQMINQGIILINEATRYHGYKDPNAPQFLSYQVLDDKKLYQPIPRGHLYSQKPTGSTFRPDYGGILKNLNICDYVDNKGVKEVWMYGYHSDKNDNGIEPDESRMSSRYGDVSNSQPKEQDIEEKYRMPLCKNSYVLYNFTYQPTGDPGNNLHNRGHQIENVIPFVEGTWPPTVQNTQGSIYWGNFSEYIQNNSPFVTQSGQRIQNYLSSCGNIHEPPNWNNEKTEGYRYDLKNIGRFDCESWNPDPVKSTYINSDCKEWGCTDVGFYKWFMQNIPGYNNGIEYQGKKMRNWWEAMYDFNAFIDKGKSLFGDSIFCNAVASKTTIQSTQDSSSSENTANQIIQTYGAAKHDELVLPTNDKSADSIINPPPALNSPTPQPIPTPKLEPPKLIDFNNDGVINIFDYIIFAQKKLGS